MVQKKGVCAVVGWKKEGEYFRSFLYHHLSFIVDIRYMFGRARRIRVHVYIKRISIFYNNFELSN